jgi:hypothetical protein
VAGQTPLDGLAVIARDPVAGGDADPLAVGLRCEGDVVGFIHRGAYGVAEQVELFVQHGVAWRRCDRQQVLEHRGQPAAHLWRCDAGEADLFEGQPDEGLPVRRRDHDS